MEQPGNGKIRLILKETEKGLKGGKGVWKKRRYNKFLTSFGS